ncbi:MAG TPA: signal peptidase I [Verrucomicrobiae bacterium]
MMNLRWFISKAVREATAVHKHYARLLTAQRDVLSPQAVSAVQAKLEELRAAIINEGHTGRIRIKAEELQFAAEKWLKPYPNAAWRENVEVLLVALAVAMAIRTFFLQPFKIPTGSMQPTLFGVTAYPDYSHTWEAARYGPEDRARAEFQKQLQAAKDMVIPTGWERIKEWFAGNSYLHIVADADGTVEAGPVTHLLIFNLKQSYTLGGVEHTIWFPPDYGEAPGGLNPFAYRAGIFPGRIYHKGEDIVKLKMSAGDHLFVDRFSYNFRKPDRGDTIVFQTEGIPEEMRDKYRDGNGNPIPADQFYIKRLVALPGEKVSIGNDRHLRINGTRLDASTPHFERVYGFDPKQPPQQSQWSGHVNGAVAQKYGFGNPPIFPDEETVYDVPPDSCMPMGDNTCNSLDSRYWGAIPEKYVIGKSFFVYWPLTDRFGCGNR